MARAQRENDDFIAIGDEEETRQGLWVLYQGYWLKLQTAESIMLVEAQFKPRPDDLFLATYPKCGTTWLKALAFTVTNRHRHATGNNAHPLLKNHPQDLVPGSGAVPEAGTACLEP
jgi:hypothetical protein